MMARMEFEVDYDGCFKTGQPKQSLKCCKNVFVMRNSLQKLFSII